MSTKLMSMTTIALLACLHAGGAAAAQSAPQTSRSAPEERVIVDLPAMPGALAGSWKAETERLPLTSEFDRSVWGPSASSVRDVDLQLTASGDGTLTIRRRVTNAKGATVPGSASLEEVKFQVGAARTTPSGRQLYEVTVASGERRYPDDPGFKWALDGVQIELAEVPVAVGRELEVRFAPADGKGGLVATLTKGRTTARR